MQRFVRVMMMMVLLAAVGLSNVALAGGGSSKPTDETAETETRTPEQEAAVAYNLGISARNKAWKLEKQLETATEPKQQEKLDKKLSKSWKTAEANFERAVSKNPTLYEAHSDLGYCLRKQGRYDEALAAYDRALEIQPRYAEAIEYRAEAYLGLNRLDEAKQAYMLLFKGQSDQAPPLLEAMQQWVEAHSANPGNAAGADIEAFSAWVTERVEIADQTKSVSQLKDADW